ncbi:hypothetical protein WN093_09170 [Gammaproteobacteria bacterium AS21]|jgi:hypothetical protein
MPCERHPDIEIYIKNTEADQIIAWLASLTNSLLIDRQDSNSSALSLSFNTATIQARIQYNVSGKAWSSLWFKQNETPWDNDLDCAKAASLALTAQVRCVKSGWSDQEDISDDEQWWKIEDNETVLISWKG